MPRNSPHAIANFVGRRAELNEARMLLASHRLVTVTGIGGVGKTRLAMELTDGLARSVAGKLFFVALASIESAELAPVAVANAILTGEAGSPDLQATLTSELSRSPTVLVLDNCEHLLPALAQWTSELLAACATLRILATSRARFGVPGEAVISLGPLEDAEALELIRVRSSATVPALRMTPPPDVELLALCRNLDNLPLAIELAAGRLSSISVLDLTLRVRNSLSAVGIQHGVPGRHRDLEAALEWSYRLLSAEQQTAWKTLAVFPSSFSLKLAEAVIGRRAPALLDELVSRSIVSYSPNAGGRYWMLQTVRQFGESRLSDAERAASEAILMEEMLSLAVEAEAALAAPGQDLGLLALMFHEQDNLRRALSLAARTHGEAALRLAFALAQYWDIRGQLHEAAHWTAAALVDQSVHGRTYVQTLDVAGWIAIRLGDYPRARELLEEAAGLATKLGESDVLARAQSNLGLTALIAGDFETAEDLLERSLAAAKHGSDSAVQLGPLFIRASLRYFEGDTTRALEDAVASVELARARGNRKTLALCLGGLGNLLMETGQQDAARANLVEALSICVVIEDRVNSVLILGAWCRLLAAERHYHKVVALADALEHMRSLVRFAQIPIWQARVDEAVDLSRAAVASRPSAQRTQVTVPADLPAIAKYLGVAFATDGPARFSRPNPLTERERQIAGLVAEGLGNREIATRLFIGTRTVETHVEHILQKLTLPNRLAIARWQDETRPI